MATEIQTVSICALVGLTCFVFGAYFQREVTIKNLMCLVRSDPYAFQNRRKLYGVLSTLFKDNIEDRLKPVDQKQFRDHLRDFLIEPLYSVGRFFFIVRNERTEAPDLLALMKYGFPGTGDIRVLKDYVVCYDKRSYSASWICEHLICNYKKLQTTETGDCLKLRFNDVYILSNGLDSIGKVFKSELWSNLEAYIVELTEKYGSVYAYSGPIFLPYYKNSVWTLDYEIVEWNPVPVPTFFFKVIIIDSQLSHCSPYMEGYIIPNRKNFATTELRRFICEIDEIERYSGLKFVSNLRHNMIFKNESYGKVREMQQQVNTTTNILPASITNE